MTPHLLEYCASGQNSILTENVLAGTFFRTMFFVVVFFKCACVGTLFRSSASVFLLSQTSVDMVFHLSVSATTHIHTWAGGNYGEGKCVNTFVLCGVQDPVVEWRSLMNNWWQASHYILAWEEQASQSANPQDSDYHFSTTNTNTMTCQCTISCTHIVLLYFVVSNFNQITRWPTVRPARKKTVAYMIAASITSNTHNPSLRHTSSSGFALSPYQ